MKVVCQLRNLVPFMQDTTKKTKLLEQLLFFARTFHGRVIAVVPLQTDPLLLVPEIEGRFFRTTRIERLLPGGGEERESKGSRYEDF